MNILLVNHYAGSPIHGMEFRPYYLAREWVRAGHQVQIVAASYSHIRARQPEMSSGVVKNEMIDGIHYRWYATPLYNGNGIGRVKNILSFLRQIWLNSKQLAHNFKPDVVIASSTYPMDIWPARRIARMAGAKLVYEVHDLWPLSPIEIGGMSPWHPFIRLCFAAENAAYRYSDLVVSMLPHIQSHVLEKGLPLYRLVIIPNGFSADEWQPDIAQSLRSDIQNTIDEAHFAGELLVVYTGSHGLPNALDSLLDTANLLRDEPIRFILVGDGHERRRLLDRVYTERLANVHMFEPIPKLQIPTLLSACDMAYLGAPNQPLYRFGVSPNKMLDYMMAGIPILYAIEAGNDPVAEADCGFTVPSQAPQALAVAIRQIAKMHIDRRREMGANGRRYATAHHSYGVLAESFLNAINKSSPRK